MKIFLSRYPKNPNRKRRFDIRIDDYDLFCMDHTLAVIIVPMLMKLKDSKGGIPGQLFPEGLHDYTAEEKAAAKAKWEEILDKMIWSFYQISIEHENSPKFPLVSDDYRKNPKYQKYAVREIDEWRKNQAIYEARIQEGLDLFAKFFQSFWT